MFQNFKLSKFFSSLSITDTKEQSTIHKHSQQSSNIKAHDIENFYQDFLLIQSQSPTQQNFSVSTLSQSNSSHYSLNSNSNQQTYGHSQILYLKDKKHSPKFIQVGKQFSDHIAIKFQVFNKKQTQRLKKKLDLQLQLKESLSRQTFNQPKRLSQTNLYVQLLVNYYIEEINSFCSSFTYVYIVLQKWNEGILDIINNLLETQYQNKSQSRIPIIKEKSCKQLYENNSSNASTFISMKNTNFPSTQKKLSPINKIENINESRYLGKSRLGYQNQNSNQIFINPHHIQIINPPHIQMIKQKPDSNLKQNIAKQLLKMVQNVILGLKEEFKMSIVRSQIKVCNMIFQGNYKISNSHLPEQVLMKIVGKQNCNPTYDQRLPVNNLCQMDNYEKILSTISYPSPQQLSQIIKDSQDQHDNCKKQSNDLSFSSLLFKLGMVSLELLLFYEWKLNIKQKLITNLSKNKSYIYWKSIKDKIYVLDPSYQAQIDINQIKTHKNHLKIDWLQISNLLINIQQSLQQNPVKNTYNQSNPLNQNNQYLSLFVKILKCLLNRSAIERNKIFTLFPQIEKTKILKKQQQIQSNQKVKLNPFNKNHLNSQISLGSKQRCFIPNYSQPFLKPTESNFIGNFNDWKNINTVGNNSKVDSNHPIIPERSQQINFISERPYPNLLKNHSNIQTNQVILINQKKQHSGKISPLTLKNQRFVSNFNQQSFSYKISQNSQNSLQFLKAIHQNSFTKTKNLDQYHFTKTQFLKNDEIKKSQVIEIKVDSINERIHSAPLLFSVQKNHQSIQKNFMTPNFGIDVQKCDLFKFNSVSQDAKKKLFQKYQNFQEIKGKTSTEFQHQILNTDVNMKQISQHSLSQLPELQEQSPINKKPSTLSKPQQQQSQLPDHLPESSKQDIIFSNVNSEISKDNILIQEDNEQVKEKVQEQTLNRQSSDDQYNNQTNQKPEVNQNQQALKINDQHLQQLQSLEYIEDNQPQTVTQAEYVIESYKGGGSYQGYVTNKKRNGYGKLYYHDGSRYQGEWLQDQMNGYGKLYYSSGLLAYQGNWHKDQFHGSGKVYNDTPTMLDDTFDYTNFNNLQQQWAYYEGQLQHDLKQGHGIIMLENGEYFEGDFHADRINGQGKFVNLEGQTIHGVWKDNVLVQLIEI